MNECSTCKFWHPSSGLNQTSENVLGDCYGAQKVIEHFMLGQHVRSGIAVVHLITFNYGSCDQYTDKGESN